MLGPGYVEFIHDALVAQVWPGTDPVASGEYRNRKLIESATGRPFHSVLGEDAYPTIIGKGVALFHSLISNHAFYNGNKRTAVIALDHFLMANGYFLAVDNGEMYKLAEVTATYNERKLSHDESLSEIMEVLREDIIPIELLVQDKEQNLRFIELHGALVQFGAQVRDDPRNELMNAE
jgi:death-on-curing protein